MKKYCFKILNMLIFYYRQKPYFGQLLKYLGHMKQDNKINSLRLD